MMHRAWTFLSVTFQVQLYLLELVDLVNPRSNYLHTA